MRWMKYHNEWLFNIDKTTSYGNRQYHTYNKKIFTEKLEIEEIGLSFSYLLLFYLREQAGFIIIIYSHKKVNFRLINMHLIWNDFSIYKFLFFMSTWHSRKCKNTWFGCVNFNPYIKFTAFYFDIFPIGYIKLHASQFLKYVFFCCLFLQSWY